MRAATKYADIGGCYTLPGSPQTELLTREKRQARSLVILREAHPGYIMPRGRVERAGEAVRQASGSSPHKFATLQEALDFVGKKMDIPVSRWIETSAPVLKDTMRQRRTCGFFKAK